MDREGTSYWLNQIIPAELTFADRAGHHLAFAALPNEENLVATTEFANIDTGLQAPDEGTPKPVRCELLSVARAPQEELAAVLIEAAELLDAARVIPAQPGTLLPKLGPGKHGMLVAPWLWGGQTPQLKEPDRWTLMLQLVALTDEEYGFAVEEGVPAFQQAVAEASIDLLDWTRFPG
ncbi:suppressor of fused domain protein [uncultured Corynebacterium sp.]|uniref:suppressor of fused domain protein n=1 Tax=uncultured Corynebacterium sp. TaxID=159447 RepID=UPI0025F1E184|nr:suppressor of fused domain protein [uncultured Corynebacterium sp.]